MFPLIALLYPRNNYCTVVDTLTLLQGTLAVQQSAPPFLGAHERTGLHLQKENLTPFKNSLLSAVGTW